MTTMQRQKGLLYQDIQVRLVTDERATRAAILDGLEWMQKNTTTNDIGMVFLSGHGRNGPGGDYYIPVNVEANRLRQTAVSDLQKAVRSISGKVVMS